MYRQTGLIISLSTAAMVLFFMVTGQGIVSASEHIKPMSIDEFLLTSENDLTLQSQEALTLYLNGAPSSTPYIDRMELRTKTDEFDLDKQTYSLRFYPKGWGETTVTKRVNDLRNNHCRTEQKKYYNKALKQRYEMVLDYVEAKKLFILKKKLVTVCEDRIRVVEGKSAGSITFDISDLISAEELLIKLKLELVKLENKITGLTNQITLAANSNIPVSLDAASLVQVSTIEQLITMLIREEVFTNVAIQDQKNRVDLANAKYKLEEAKNKDFLSFFEVSYDREDSDDPGKAVCLELAFKLPFIHSDRDEINQKKVKYMEERLEYKKLERDIYEKRISLVSSLNQMIKQYALLTANKENSNAEVSFKAYLQMDGVDPLDLLKIHESILKSDTQLVKIEFNIRSRFINLMDIMGKLQEKPFKNYLKL